MFFCIAVRRHAIGYLAICLGYGTLPYPMTIFLAYGETCNAKKVGDIIDDEIAEATVGEERKH